MWMICTVLRTQYEIDALKERFARMEELEVKIESQQEQINDLQEQLSSYKEESRVKLDDLESQCELYCKFSYRVIELTDQNAKMTKQLEALQDRKNGI